MAFESFDDGAQRNDLLRERSARLTSSAWTKYQYVNVTFPGSNADVDIAHQLNPSVPTNVRFIPISLNAAAIIYRDTSGTAKAWQVNHIFLRSNVACTARLLLFLETQPIS